MTTRDEDGIEWTQTFSPDNRLEQVTDGAPSPDLTEHVFLFIGPFSLAWLL